MPEIHYALGGSNVYRWTACPGSIKASEGLANESSPAADEGTRVHNILEEATRRGSIPQELVEKPSDVTSVQLALDAIDYQRGLSDGSSRHNSVSSSAAAPPTRALAI